MRINIPNLKPDWEYKIAVKLMSVLKKIYFISKVLH